MKTIRSTRPLIAVVPIPRFVVRLPTLRQNLQTVGDTFIIFVAAYELLYETITNRIDCTKMNIAILEERLRSTSNIYNRLYLIYTKLSLITNGQQNSYRELYGFASAVVIKLLKFENFQYTCSIDLFDSEVLVSSHFPRNVVKGSQIY